MLVESVKDGVYHLSHVGDTGTKKKGKIQGKSLQPIDTEADKPTPLRHFLYRRYLPGTA